MFGPLPAFWLLGSLSSKGHHGPVVVGQLPVDLCGHLLRVPIGMALGKGNGQALAKMIDDVACVSAGITVWQFEVCARSRSEKETPHAAGSAPQFGCCPLGTLPPVRGRHLQLLREGVAGTARFYGRPELVGGDLRPESGHSDIAPRRLNRRCARAGVVLRDHSRHGIHHGSGCR